ncbi:MAG: MltA domain-containing protein [Rhizobacter sp.]|nr:MltA domain-containing protein [Rhizobacter sp.]
MVHHTINTNTSSAPSASSNSKPMMNVFVGGRRFLAAAILGGLAACAGGPAYVPPPSAPALTPPSTPPSTPAATPPGATTSRPAPVVMQRGHARWVSAQWADLPGWEADPLTELWPALQRGCDKPPLEWARICVEVRTLTPASDASARAWLQQRVQPWRVESTEGVAEGLITGYFEPLVEARRVPGGAYRIPLYGPPGDLATRKPWWTRQQIGSHPAAQAALRGRAIAYVADPLDALILQIQGSGRLDLIESSGQRKLVRLAYAGHNDQPYKSVGKWLIEQGELRAEQASWPAIKAWARAHPKRIDEMLASNPRYVFFREEPLPDPALGPKGAQNVPLTPGRSIAVDSQSVPYGAPVWLDTTEPLASTPLRRLVMAQDTGSAITGAVRADYFWGWGEVAEQQAGRMKQPLRMWVLWPKN